MEPADDIPPSATPAQPRPTRFTSRHVLRMLAAVLLVSATIYTIKVWKLDGQLLTTHRQQDLLAISPVFLFGAILWWYAGRKMDEISRPLFRNRSDSPTDARVDLRNVCWLVLSIVSGFVGMAAIIVGGTFALHGKELHAAMPDFFNKLEQRVPKIQGLEATPAPIIWAGALLVGVAALALGLAMRRQARAAKA
ncbi:MAG TPA: hypothetical protein VHC95_01565 [Opitutales bacterium]|nr:hypothetical protein [Opitutales bacterium]